MGALQVFETLSVYDLAEAVASVVIRKAPIPKSSMEHCFLKHCFHP